jgi:hypothetical protein
MAGVLTTASTVKCGHGSGKVQTSSSAKLSVEGNAILLKTGIVNKSVSGCGTVAKADSSGPTDKPCTSVAAVTGGEATKLKADGKPVMLDTLAGSTDGMVSKTTPQTKLKATVGQSRLTAT